jgi:hypothetical protein
MNRRSQRPHNGVDLTVGVVVPLSIWVDLFGYDHVN